MAEVEPDNDNYSSWLTTKDQEFLDLIDERMEFEVNGGNASLEVVRRFEQVESMQLNDLQKRYFRGLELLYLVDPRTRQEMIEAAKERVHSIEAQGYGPGGEYQALQAFLIVIGGYG